MKKIDIKSLLIGILITTSVIFGIGATGTTDKWDSSQEWDVIAQNPSLRKIKLSEAMRQRQERKGYEPFALQGELIIYRKRIDEN